MEKKTTDARMKATGGITPAEPRKPRVIAGAGAIELGPVTLNNHASLRTTLNSVSSVAPVFQQTSIKNLEPLFKEFTDAEVSVYATDEQPIGPRIGVADVSESTLKAIASFEVQRRGRLSDRKWHIVATGLVALVTGVVAWILRGVLGD